MVLGMNSLKKAHILLIDSDPESRKSIQDFIQQNFGFPLTVLSSINDYFSPQQLNKYHLVFVEVKSIECHGFHLLKKIDSNQINAIIMPLISQPNSCSLEEIIQSGANDYIIKPVNFLEMKAKILKAFREQKLFHQLKQKINHLETLAQSILENHDELEARTAEMNIEREILRSQVDGYTQMVENAVDIIFSIDGEGRIESVNKIISKLSGYTQEEIIGKNISCFIHQDFIPCVQKALKEVFHTGVIKKIELILTTKTNNVVLVEMNAVSRFDYLGHFIGIWAILRDITERKRLEEELKQLSIIDSLTKLHNKRYFLETLEKEIYRALRQNYPLSLIMIDLDGFKLYNDIHGHLAGDRVLAKVGDMFRCQCRIGVDIPCRYGGDEFIIILPQVDKHLAYQIAQRYQKAWEKEKMGDIGLSIGITQYDGYSSSMEELIRGADEAMYQSKWAGGNKVSIF